MLRARSDGLVPNLFIIHQRLCALEGYLAAGCSTIALSGRVHIDPCHPGRCPGLGNAGLSAQISLALFRYILSVGAIFLATQGASLG